ncbi:GlsB/YeaQ/YmgE family stress response membrane protein [Sandarakinorhabdus sp. AAP62]|uniref:GlsB/YeaQ/YmgE family stress response membrane protein n=1 Tax=Sandarakinorhabdus sp. AAP62 TaxID=1248916 RepID=UPI00036AD9EF|nr:GlsB/YeaQ/YmgE family stress response membrane protein [Sandarakinorhabdus sp. AAP62]
MGWIEALIVGGLAGWLASMVMNRDNSMGLFLNIVVGCVGSGLGNLLLNPFGIAGPVQNFSLTGLLVAVVGDVVLLAIVNLVRRSSVRWLWR